MHTTPATGPTSADTAGAPSALRVAMTLEQLWHPVPGGTATSMVHVARAMREGLGLSLVGVAARHSNIPSAELDPLIEMRHLPLSRAALYRTWQMLRTPPVQLATGPVDVVHATTFAIPPRRGPLVVTIHDLAFLDDPGHFTPRGNRFFRRGLELTKNEADLVAVPSAHTARACIAAGLPEAKVRVVPHGATPLPVSDDLIAQVRERWPSERPFILGCGTFEPRKNLFSLVVAFKHMLATGCDHDLVLVGPAGWGDSGLEQELPEGRVHVLGYVPEDQLHALYRSADVLCYPSLREGFGMPVLEAMSHGTPVVTSTGTPMEDIAGDAGIAVPATDTHHIAEALTQVIAQREQFSARAEQRATDFTWARAAQSMAQVYREAIEA